MNLSKEHMAKVLNEWAAYYVKEAQARYARAAADLTEEHIQLRVAKAVEEDRNRRNDGDWGGGFGPPTAEQAYAESIKRAETHAMEASRILQNNVEMLAYIKEITSK